MGDRDRTTAGGGPGPALYTDLYELTMLQAYFEERMHDQAVFSLFVRRLPERRNHLLACGLDTALCYLEQLEFGDSELGELADTGQFSERFLRWLGDFRFTGEVEAVPEGTPVFAEEPLLEVVAPLPQAQLAETIVMNQVHLQTTIASKVARLVQAADGRPVVDFSARRLHGVDAGLGAVRAGHVAGLSATSNILGGRIHGVPLRGTMAHSYIQAHDDELDAFRAFARVHGETVLLVDTYDTLEGTRKVVQLAREMGEAFRVRAIRLDSGDLLELSRRCREILDDGRLPDVQIFASGSLDEDRIDGLLRDGAPIDGFGVGTSLGVSEDVPALDIAYKLVRYAGVDRVKRSTGKRTLPGRKQVYRIEENNSAVRDIIALADEDGLPGRPLLETFMRHGQRVPATRTGLDRARARAEAELTLLPAVVREIAPLQAPYPVVLSDGLSAQVERLQG